MSNPFKNPTLRAQYEAMSRAHLAKDSELFWVDGSSVRGSPEAQAFWDGFEGVDADIAYATTASRETPGYACWRAGQDAKRHDHDRTS